MRYFYKPTKAAEALNDLNMAHAILQLCEGSLFRTTAGKRFEAKISKLCREHAQSQLRVIDNPLSDERS